MRAALVLVFGVVLAAPARAQGDLGSEAQREAGKRVYDKYCAQCHGDAGDGAGHAAGRVRPTPRDFTTGTYKFRTTPSGMLPTDDDLRRVIENGLPYTSMPGWPELSDDEVRDVIYHLKTYAPAFQSPDKHAQPIDIPSPPASSAESIERGRVVYEEQGCAACHGELGRSDGPSAPTLTDDWGDPIRPADLTLRWTFRGGPTRRDVFRTFSTGVNGTPMPSYADSLAIEQRWDLVNYIESIGDGDAPDYKSLLVSRAVDVELDLEQGAALFEGAPRARFPLFGQIVEPGRAFHPLTTSVVVQAVHNRTEIAFLVRWHDMTEDAAGTNSPALAVPPEEDDAAAAPAPAAGGEDDFWGAAAAPAEPAPAADDFWGEATGDAAATGAGFTDAVALQFPTRLPLGIRKPYFIFGDAQNPVDLWFLEAGSPRVAQFTGRGSTSLEPSEADDIGGSLRYDRGEWTAIFKRSLRGRGGVSFEPAQFVPLAFSVWDGHERERGNKRALSAWFYLYPAPAQQVSTLGPMLRAGGLTLLIELLVVGLVRWRAKGAPAPARQALRT